MHAEDIMTTAVLTVTPDTEITELADIMLANRISALPVVDEGRQIVGIVSEGDLMRRPELETQRRRSWWLALLSADSPADDFVKSHGRRARDVMTSDVITVDAEADVGEIAALLEKHRIKRVPVLKDGQLVGIVSRANLLHGLRSGAQDETGLDDRAIRTRLNESFTEAGLQLHHINLVVTDGVVNLFGSVRSKAEKEAVRVALENVPGIKRVNGEVSVVPNEIVVGT